MKIRIKSFYAVGSTEKLRAYLDADEDMALEVPAGSTIGELLCELPGVGPPGSFDDIMIHVFVNGNVVGFDHRLEPDDVLDIHIPVSGG